MSQEIRTQMNSIVGLSFLIEEGNSECNRNITHSDQLYRICNQLAKLFENFVSTELIENSSSSIRLTKCDPVEFFSREMAEFSNMVNQYYNGDVLLIEENYETVPVNVLMDRFKVERILQSLFQNAVCQNRKGYLRSGWTMNGDTLTFYIHDPYQDYSMLKDILDTAENEKLPARIYDTTSMVNLALAKKNTKLLGGSIIVEHFDLNGASIYFSFPVKSDEKTVSETVLNYDANL
jgi:hypothetical protein